MNDIQEDAVRIDCLAIVGDKAATIPGAAILGLTRVQEGAEVHRIGPALLLTWNGTLVPVIDLAADMGMGPRDVQEGILVIVSQPAPDGPKALLVDSVWDQGDGESWTDAPVPEVVAAYAGEPVIKADVAPVAMQEVEPDLFLTVGAGGNTYLLPLGDIARIEPFPEGGLQPCGNGYATVLSGRLVRAVALFACNPGSRPDQSLVVVVRGTVQVALVIDALGDIVEPSSEPRLPWGRDGIVEARVVGGAAIGIVDLDAAVAEPAALRRAA